MIFIYFLFSTSDVRLRRMRGLSGSVNEKQWRARKKKKKHLLVYFAIYPVRMLQLPFRPAWDG